MSGLDERHQAMEAKLAHDSDLKFKVRNRRNRLLGEWVNTQLGLEGDAAETQIKALIHSDFEEVGDEDMIRHVAADFLAQDKKLDTEAVRAMMPELALKAHDQIMNEN